MRNILRVAIFSALILIVGLHTFAQQFTLLKDINMGVSGQCLGYPREPLNLTEANGSLYFTIYGIPDMAGLWKSDGTAAGTVRIKQVDYIDRMINLNGTIFFANDNTNELWKSNGTAQGTVVVKNITATNLIAVNDILYFRTIDGQLWKTDGSSGGTVIVKSSVGTDLLNANGTLFFPAAGGPPFNGAALWKTDGTPAGTVMVSDPAIQYGSIRE